MMKRRREVELFADAMEKELKENDYKGGWKNYSRYSFFDMIDEEIDKLMAAVSLDDPKRILSEAADVANIAMMIADVCGGLESEVEHNDTARNY